MSIYDFVKCLFALLNITFWNRYFKIAVFEVANPNETLVVLFAWLRIHFSHVVLDSVVDVKLLTWKQLKSENFLGKRRNFGPVWRSGDCRDREQLLLMKLRMLPAGNSRMNMQIGILLHTCAFSCIFFFFFSIFSIFK
jgi:hypothetical protein